MNNPHWPAALLAAALFLCACSSGDCDKPCRLSDSCPDFSGSYTLMVQILNNECGTLVFSKMFLQVSAVVGDDGTDLTAELDDISMSGRVCNTARTAYPLTYDFAVSATSMGDKNTVTDNLSGQFVVLEGGGEHLCASYFHMESDQRNTCRDSAVFVTSSTVCQ